MQKRDNGQSLRQLRLNDLKTGVALLLFSIAILAETLTYPMTDSWGGVENVWYVSPALFPLAVGTVLLILSLILLRTSLTQLNTLSQGESLWRQLTPRLHRYTTRKNRDTQFIIGLLVFYVYLLIPYTDFFLATVVFQLSLCARFLFESETLNRRRSIAYLLFVPLHLLLLFGAIIESPDMRIWLIDLNVFAFSLVLLIQPLRIRNQIEDFARQYRYLCLVSLLAPLLLVVAFQYLLLVPMPTEGSVIQLMDIVRYDLF